MGFVPADAFKLNDVSCLRFPQLSHLSRLTQQRARQGTRFPSPSFPFLQWSETAGESRAEQYAGARDGRDIGGRAAFWPESLTASRRDFGSKPNRQLQNVGPHGTLEATVNAAKRAETSRFPSEDRSLIVNEPGHIPGVADYRGRRGPKTPASYYAGVGADGDTQAGELEARTLRGEYISAGQRDRVTGIKLIAGSEPARQQTKSAPLPNRRAAA